MLKLFPLIFRLNKPLKGNPKKEGGNRIF